VQRSSLLAALRLLTTIFFKRNSLVMVYSTIPKARVLQTLTKPPAKEVPFLGEHQTIPSTDRAHAQHDQQAHQPDQAGPKK
jgi:hypothetical protein